MSFTLDTKLYECGLKVVLDLGARYRYKEKMFGVDLDYVIDRKVVTRNKDRKIIKEMYHFRCEPKEYITDSIVFSFKEPVLNADHIKENVLNRVFILI